MAKDDFKKKNFTRDFVKVHNKLVGMGYIKQHYGQQGIGKEDFARPYVKEKKLWKVIRNATIRQKSA